MEVNYSQLENIANCASGWFTKETDSGTTQFEAQMICLARLLVRYDIRLPSVTEQPKTMLHLLAYTTDILKALRT